MTLAPPRSEPVTAPADPEPGGLPAWPVTGLLLWYPAWWALGLGVLVFPFTAAVMLVALWRRRSTVALPPGFGLWLTFLAVAVVSVAALGAHPAGTVAGTASGRLLGVVYRLAMYGSLTVLLVYLGNARMTQRRLVGLLGWLFAVTVAGGLLGTFAGNFAFDSPVELLLPKHIRSTGFVQSLVHPAAAQVMDLIGGALPRPAAPWGYTNTWGNNVCLLVGWFVVALWGRRPLWTVLGLALATVPIVYSLNRGLWIGLGVVVVYLAVRLAARGRLLALSGVAVAAVVVGVALAVTPLGTVVQHRLDAGKSNGVRLYLTQQAVDGLRESPLIGFGSTRNTQGGRNSITVGESDDCERCGNFTVGGNGQFWQLLFAHGLLGTLAYLGFFGYGLWRFRRDATPVGLVGSAAIVSTFAAMFWYNALVTPLAFTFCAYALLWRNERHLP
jgi:hypothetical protein